MIEVTLSSGVTVEVMPFPGDLYSDVQAKAQKDFPDPVPPKKTIKVVDGTEEIDDLDDGDYKVAKLEASHKRNAVIGRAILDTCVRVNMEKWEPAVRRMERYTDPFPTDPDDRRLAFLEKYAFRTGADHRAVMKAATDQIFISDEEVADRQRFFRRTVARGLDSDAPTPGPVEEVGVDIPSGVS